MEHSSLESIPDSVIIYVCETILEDFINNHQYDFYDDRAGGENTIFEDSDKVDIIKTAISSVGIKTEMIDVDYIINILLLNDISKYESENKNKKLVRPDVKEYSLFADIFETLYQKEIYKHQKFSYFDRNSQVKTIFRYEVDFEDLNERDGKHIDTEVYDMDFNEVIYRVRLEK